MGIGWGLRLKDDIGVIHGRFQVLHNGHMEYLLAGKSRCKCLIIGISNYLGNNSNPRISSIDNHRLTSSANPFTYFERMEMITLAMEEAGISKNEFEIVPFPIETPELIFNFVPKSAVFYMTIYDEWGHDKKRVLFELGVKIDVMWERSEAQKPISGSLVRAKIEKYELWNDLVPDSVFKYIQKNNLEERIRNGK